MCSATITVLGTVDAYLRRSLLYRHRDLHHHHHHRVRREAKKQWNEV